MKNLKAAIFDLDGVIVNTVPIHFKAWKRLFKEYGRKFTFDDYLEKVDGIPRIDGTRAILKGMPEKKIIKAAEKKQGYFVEALSRSKVPVFRSTVRLVKEFRNNGIKVAAISSSKNCRDILTRAKIIKLFEIVLTGEDITSGKPDPQIFLLAAKKLKVKPSECVVFEDAILGVEAAKRARMFCVGIDREGKPARLKKADIIVADLKETNLDKLLEL